jgi:type IV pilus assembly protein PilQ
MRKITLTFLLILRCTMAFCQPSISFDFKDADIRDVIRAIATQTKTNIVLDEDIQARVTIHLSDVEFEQALKILLETHGLTYTKIGKIYRVQRLKREVPKEEEISIVEVKDGRISIDVRRMPIREFLRLITEKSGINIISDKTVTGEISMYVKDLPFKKGLNAILSAYGLVMREEDGVYRVSTLARRMPLLISISDGLLYMDVKDGDLVEVVRRIGELVGKNIVIFGHIKEKVNLCVSGISPEEALKLIFKGTRYTLRSIDGTYLIGDPVLTNPGSDLLTEERLIRLRFIEAKKIPMLLPPSIPQANLRVIEPLNAIIIKATPDLILQLQRFIALIDKRPEGIDLKDGRLTIDVKDCDLVDLLQSIASITGINLKICGTIQEKVTVSFTNFKVDEALRFILKGTRYALKRVDDTYIVGNPALTTPAASILTTERLIYLHHIKPKDLLPLLPPNIPKENLKEVEAQNAVLVKGPSTLIDEVERVIEKLDKPPVQIMIETLVLELTRREGEEFWFEGTYTKDWKRLGIKPGLLTFATGVLPEDLSITIQALISEGRAKVRANPKIATLNGKEAMINVGWVKYFEITQFTGTPPIPYTTLQTVDAGITLKITPWVDASGNILVELQPEVSDATGIGPQGLPEISRRRVDTTIRVKDGETIVIGGLIQTQESEAIERTPILSRIPLLGRLFTKRKKQLTETELIIYLTPRILKREDV